MKRIAAETRDVNGDVHMTCHFVPIDPAVRFVKRGHASSMPCDALGLLGVHVYLPEMSWAKRVVQQELARAAILDDARAVREAMRAL